MLQLLHLQVCLRMTMSFMMQDEESGYEVKRKSLRHEDQSQSCHSATDFLAQLSLRDKERHVSFGKATLLGPGS